MKRRLTLVALLLVLQLVWPVMGAWAEGPDPDARALPSFTVAVAAADVVDFHIAGVHSIHKGESVTIHGSVTTGFLALGTAVGAKNFAAAGALAGGGYGLQVKGPKGAKGPSKSGYDGGLALGFAKADGSSAFSLAATKGNALALATAGAKYSKASALASVVSPGLVTRKFSLTFTPTRTGRWKVNGAALALALAGATADGTKVSLAADLEAMFDDVGFWVLPGPEWKPVAEHVIFTGLPADAQWGDLRRLELDGRWVNVPPLHPVDSLPNPVHADLMVHGYGGADYALRVCNQSGACQPPRYFAVNSTGSQAATIVSYPDQATELSGLVPPVF